ncbi:acyltransferase domain-containing protein, partial [Streptomyces sodiiphilus]|uniref:acyltransferase domain-containing protein n=1 Tax=Streptomyces sodiiphilus TaxID=226217 RepID=UPI0031DC9E81
DTLNECAHHLTPHTDQPLLDLLYGPAQHHLNQTRYAQIAIVSIQVALVRYLNHLGIHPHTVIGHSIGELTAAWTAGVLTLPDLLHLTAQRGHHMNNQPQTGTMAVIHADTPTTHTTITPYPDIEIAAYNTPTNHTLAGPTTTLTTLCNTTPHHTQQLNVSHAFHSAAMNGAITPFTHTLNHTTLNPPTLPFLSTTTGTWHTPETTTNPTTWANAIRQPVLFHQALTHLPDTPTHFWEIGPHPALTPLARTNLPNPHHHWHTTLRRHHNDQQQLHTHLTNHHNTGNTTINWTNHHQHKHHHHTTIPTYPFNRQ